MIDLLDLQYDLTFSTMLSITQNYLNLLFFGWTRLHTIYTHTDTPSYHRPCMYLTLYQYYCLDQFSLIYNLPHALDDD